MATNQFKVTSERDGTQKEYKKVTQKQWTKCDTCGASVKIDEICPCNKRKPNLNRLLKEAAEFKPVLFKENQRSISSALHIPYSGMGDPDYVDIFDYLQDDVFSLILECLDNFEYDGRIFIEDLESLERVFDNYDDDGSIHNYIENSLTWQQGLRECEIIINSLSEYEETDSGLWEGLQPEEAIRAKAFWTYKNALISKARETIEKFKGGRDDNEK